MKKIILLVGLVLLLSGCDATYKVEITKESFSENTTITTNKESNETYSKIPLTDFLNQSTSSYIPSFYNPENYDDLNGDYQEGVEYYEITSFENNQQTGINVSYDFSGTTFYRSRVIKSCFKELTVQKTNNLYKINTNNYCNAFDDYSLLENLSIEVTVPYPSIYNNADKVEDNTYIWNLNRDNYTEKSISIVFDLEEADLSEFDPTNIEKENPQVPVEKEKTWADEHAWLVIPLMFLIFGILISILIMIQNKRK